MGRRRAHAGRLHVGPPTRRPHPDTIVPGDTVDAGSRRCGPRDDPAAGGPPSSGGRRWVSGGVRTVGVAGRCRGSDATCRRACRARDCTDHDVGFVWAARWTGVPAGPVALGSGDGVDRAINDAPHPAVARSTCRDGGPRSVVGWADGGGGCGRPRSRSADESAAAARGGASAGPRYRMIPRPPASSLRERPAARPSPNAPLARKEGREARPRLYANGRRANLFRERPARAQGAGRDVRAGQVIDD